VCSSDLLAQNLQDELEAHPAILEAQLSGAREELLEVVIDPALLESYGISYGELVQAVSSNNRLVAAGVLETGPGRFQVKVRGLFETAEDVLELPIRASGEGIIVLRDVATVRRTFKDRESYARFDGKPALALEVRKRLGSNIIEVTDAIREITARMQENWPETVNVAFSLDQSLSIKDSIAQLGASVATAILLVMIVVVAALGVRSGLLVGLAIPSSFMLAFLMLGVAGMSINFMVLFGMVLAVGMLVDGAIVVVEYADRKIAEGLDKKEAYALAGKRMFWPITSSTATTLAAFLPFLFWNSIAGKYMSFLPKTLIFVLVASLLIALVFLPVIGGLLGGRPKGDTEAMKALAGADGDPLKAPGITGGYARLASWMVKRPIIVVGMAAFIVVGIWQWFGATEHRVEFFLDTEPEQVFVYVRARGNLSSAEMNGLGIEVESLINDIPSIQSIFTTSGPGGGVGGFGNSSPPEDTVSTLFVDFKPFGERENGRLIMAEIQRRLENVPGVMIEVRALENGPPVGKDVQVELTSNNPLALDTAARLVRRQLDETPGLVEVEDTLPLPGIEWELRVDREQAGRFGADVSQLGAAVQLVTNGVLVGRYRPNDSDEEIDIRVRFDDSARDINQLDELRIATPNGQVPIANFVTREARPQVDRITRRNGRRSIEVRANAEMGYASNLIVADLREWLAGADIDPVVNVRFLGADEETAEAGLFFLGAMGAALFIMAGILQIGRASCRERV